MPADAPWGDCHVFRHVINRTRKSDRDKTETSAGSPCQLPHASVDTVCSRCASIQAWRSSRR